MWENALHANKNHSFSKEISEFPYENINFQLKNDRNCIHLSRCISCEKHFNSNKQWKCQCKYRECGGDFNWDKSL